MEHYSTIRWWEPFLDWFLDKAERNIKQVQEIHHPEMDDEGNFTCRFCGVAAPCSPYEATIGVR